MGKTTKTTKTTRTDRPFPIVLGLGSNLGDRGTHLRWAIQRLEERLGRLEVAPLYRSRPISPIAQGDYLNTVVLAQPGDTQPPPESLLRAVKALEFEAGRRPGPRFGPRPLDIDLLLHGSHVLEDTEPPLADGTPQGLTLPHPRLTQRRFVLAPLADLVPDLPIPPEGRTVAQWLAELGDDQPIERVSWPDSV